MLGWTLKWPVAQLKNLPTHVHQLTLLKTASFAQDAEFCFLFFKDTMTFIQSKTTEVSFTLNGDWRSKDQDFEEASTPFHLLQSPTSAWLDFEEDRHKVKVIQGNAFQNIFLKYLDLYFSTCVFKAMLVKYLDEWQHKSH